MILVSGATGNVGRSLVDQLSASGIAARALTRDPSRARFPSGVDVIEGDLTRPDSLRPALAGTEALFLIHSGTEDQVLDVAKRAGVQRVVLLSALAAQTRPQSAIGRDHLVAEQAVRNSGLTWTALRPGQFASNTLNWAPQIRLQGVVRAPFARVALPTIHPADIATVARLALTDGGPDGQIYPLTGPAQISPPEQVQAMGRALDRELRFEEISAERAREQMERHLPADLVAAALDLVGHPTEEERCVLPTFEELTGVALKTFQQWAYDNVEAFR